MTTNTLNTEVFLNDIKFPHLLTVRPKPEEQVELRNAIFKLQPARIKQALAIMTRVEPQHVSISKAGIVIDIKSLTIFTQRFLQLFVHNASMNEVPSRKATTDNKENEDQKQDDKAPQQGFTGVRMASGMRDVGTDVGLVKDKQEDEKTAEKPKSPYQQEIDEYVRHLKMHMDAASANYWNVLTEELTSGKFDRVFKLLKEVVDRTKKLVPENDHKHLDDTISLELVLNAARNNALDGSMFMTLFDAIHTALRALHPPMCDEQWDTWRKTIIEKISTGTTWHELLPQMLNRFLIKLDRLEEMITAVRTRAGLSATPTNSAVLAEK